MISKQVKLFFIASMMLTSSVKVQAQVTDMCFDEVQEVASDCDKLLQQASRIIKDQNKQLQLQQMLAQVLIQDQQDILRRAKEAEDAKHAWYRNPFIMLPLGIVAGGAGVMLMERR